MFEETVLLGPARSSVGVFTPASGAGAEQSDLAVLCLNAGLVHHVGPHRMHVLLARALAARGIHCLRLDQSGIGDSAVRADDTPVEEIPVREIEEAISELESRGCHRFILFGICSGAVTAAKAVLGNSKIAGIVMVNTGADPNADVDPQYAAQFYLKSSARNPRAWKNLFTGRVRILKLVKTLAAAAVQLLRLRFRAGASLETGLGQVIREFENQGTSVLMVASDRHAQFFELYRKTLDKLENDYFKILSYPDTDHLFASLTAQRQLIEQVCLWSEAVVNRGARDAG